MRTTVSVRRLRLPDGANQLKVRSMVGLLPLLPGRQQSQRRPPQARRANLGAHRHTGCSRQSYDRAGGCDVAERGIAGLVNEVACACAGS
jgi:hypothetical protein